MRYRSKIVEIEAVKFTGIVSAEIEGPEPKWYGHARATDRGTPGAVNYNKDGTLSVETLEGAMIARPGDWIIRGTEGELYPCKPSVFERKYEPA